MRKKQEFTIDLLLIFIIRKVRENKKLIIYSFLIAVVLGFTYYKSKPPIFKSEMIVSSPVVTSERLKMIIEPLGKLAGENNISKLSQALNLPVSVVSTIKFISAQELNSQINQTYFEYDLQSLSQMNCMITVKVQGSTDLLDQVEEGILYYLRENYYVKKKSQVNKKNQNNFKTRIQREIVALDSMRIIMSKNNYMNVDPTTINKSIVELYEQELQAEEYENLDVDGVGVIRGFTKYDKPSEPVLLFSVLGSIAIWLMFVILYIGIKDIDFMSVDTEE